MTSDVLMEEYAQRVMESYPLSRPKLVKFVGRDQGEGLPRTMFEDPRTWKPKPGPLGWIESWGLYPYDSANFANFDGIAAMMRQMSTQMLYAPTGSAGAHKTPEKQFVDVLKALKAKELASLELNGLDQRDVIIRIFLRKLENAQGEDRVWRRFKVSSGIKLSTLQDKVIAPIMGWVRNLHCYTFTDLRDGSLFGPEKSTSVDRPHSAQVGYDWLPDHKYPLAQLFSKEGDRIGYLYDFGDKWYHQLIIEKILSLEESDGRVEILEGKGMCPGENLQGCFIFHESMKEYDNADATKKITKKREILRSPNYTGFGKPPVLFDPDSFDMAWAKKCLSEALDSTNSAPEGAKKYTIPMHPDHAGGHQNLGLSQGRKVVKTFEREDMGDPLAGYWEEIQNEKDRRSAGVCAACGKPGGADLKRCGGCRQILYCSAEHQREHWKRVHKMTCSKEYQKK